MKKIILSILCLLIVSATTNLYGQKIEARFLLSVKVAHPGSTTAIGNINFLAANVWRSDFDIISFPLNYGKDLIESKKDKWSVYLTNKNGNPVTIDLHQGKVIMSGQTLYTILSTKKSPPRVIVYNKKNFKGGDYSYFAAGEHVSHFGKIGGNHNDNIASIKVPRELKVTIYRDPAFRGRGIVMYPGDYKLCNYWNSISSMKVEKLSEDEIGAPTVAFYSKYKSEYGHDDGGTMQVLGVGQYTKKDIFCNDCITEMQVDKGLFVTLYSEDNFRGEATDKDATKYDSRKGGMIYLKDMGFNNRTTSLTIESSRLELFAIDMGQPIGIQNPDYTKSVATANSNVNDTGSDAKLTSLISVQKGSEKVLVQGKELTATTSVTLTVGTSEAAATVTGVNLEVSMTNELSAALSESRSKAESSSEEVAISSEIMVKPGCRGITSTTLTPTEFNYKAKFSYHVVDSEGIQIPGAPDEIKEVDMTVIRSYVTDFIGRTFCKDEVLDKMLNNAWQVDNTSNNDLKGTFTKSGTRGNLVWKTVSGKSTELKPDWAGATYNAIARDRARVGKFSFGIKGGELEYLESKGKKFYSEAWNTNTTNTGTPTNVSNPPAQTSTATAAAATPHPGKLKAAEAKSVTVGAKGSTSQIGDFSFVSTGLWRSVINSQTTQYTELRRGPWGIFLKNKGSGQTIVINLWTQKVLKGSANGEEIYKVLTNSKDAIAN